MKIKGWKLVKETNNYGNFYMEWHTFETSEVKGTYRPMTIENGFVWLANAITPDGQKVFQVRIGKFDKIKNNMPSKDYRFKTKSTALQFARNYMRQN